MVSDIFYERVDLFYYVLSLLQEFNSQCLVAAPNGTNATNTDSNPQSGSHHSDTGAIAGGTVAGVLVVILAAVALWLLLWRRRRSEASLDRAGLRKEMPELGTGSVFLDKREPPARPHATGLDSGLMNQEARRYIKCLRQDRSSLRKAVLVEMCPVVQGRDCPELFQYEASPKFVRCLKFQIKHKTPEVGFSHSTRESGLESD